MVKCMFKPGDRVVCIKDDCHDEKVLRLFKYWPLLHHTYTVRTVVFSQGKWGITLVDVINPMIFDHINEVYFEPTYAETRFMLEDMSMTADDYENATIDEMVRELLREVKISPSLN